jgi:hypothetical protein
MCRRTKSGCFFFDKSLRLSRETSCAQLHLKHCCQSPGTALHETREFFPNGARVERRHRDLIFVENCDVHLDSGTEALSKPEEVPEL